MIIMFPKETYYTTWLESKGRSTFYIEFSTYPYVKSKISKQLQTTLSVALPM